MPRRWVLLALSLLAFAPPFVAQASGTFVGAFTMFSRLERYHLELGIVTASGEEPVNLSTLRPHLSRDARRVILPAQGYAVGADQVDVLAGGLVDIARLVCELRPSANAAQVRLYRGPFGRRETALTQAEQPCRPAQ
jgi:hypothetical protein